MLTNIIEQIEHVVLHMEPQRAVRFLDRWDDRRITELGVIHLCSQDCKDKYLKRSAA